MTKFPSHLFDEPNPDPDTLNNLGPLSRMAGVWRSKSGTDKKPTADGAEKQAYVEHYELQPIDPQLNGPQLLYGLRYHIHIVKPGEVETYHDQVGYWLWEPATEAITHTLTIPRAQAALATGSAEASANTFTVRSERGNTENGIVSGKFLEENFRTDSFEITVTFHEDGTWTYDETTTLAIKGVDKPFQHHDVNVMEKVNDPTPNPLMAQSA